jgi:16S rRNA (adenine1518-N6/adenine1519-N6)-dimethyltransferase
MTEHESSNPLVASPARMKQLLNKHNFSFKKSLGQNFLIDGNTLDRIVDVAGLTRRSGVLEIGPGAGSLTQQLAQVAGKVVAIEIDQRLLPLLQETMLPYEHVEIVHGDVLKMDLSSIWAEYFHECDDVSVVANLPYYITTPILMALLEQRMHISKMVVMMQKEVSDRMTANPGGKDYGSLSVAIQYHCEARELLRVPRSVFMPPPNVDSAVLGLFVRDKPAVQVKSEPLFFEIVRASFAQRRKTISNNLLQHYRNQYTREQLTSILETAGIEANRRAETLSIDEFARLADQFFYSLTSG